LTAGRNDEILTRWNLEKILTNRVRGIDSNPGQAKAILLFLIVAAIALTQVGIMKRKEVEA